MSKFVSNLLFGIVSVILLVTGFVFGWQCKTAAIERQEEDEANGVRRYHGIKFIKRPETESDEEA